MSSSRAVDSIAGAVEQARGERRSHTSSQRRERPRRFAHPFVVTSDEDTGDEEDEKEEDIPPLSLITHEANRSFTLSA